MLHGPKPSAQSRRTLVDLASQRTVQASSMLPCGAPLAARGIACRIPPPIPCHRFARRLPTAVPNRSRRYHYNVSNHRLDVHVTKGFDDGLFISSVCACGDLWAIIMDAGTGFTQQVGNWLRCAGGCAPVLPCAAQASRSALLGVGVLLGAALSLPPVLLCSRSSAPVQHQLPHVPLIELRRCTAWRSAPSFPRTGSWSSGTRASTSQVGVAVSVLQFQ